MGKWARLHSRTPGRLLRAACLVASWVQCPQRPTSPGSSCTHPWVAASSRPLLAVASANGASESTTDKTTTWTTTGALGPSSRGTETRVRTRRHVANMRPAACGWSIAVSTSPMRSSGKLARPSTAAAQASGCSISRFVWVAHIPYTAPWPGEDRRTLETDPLAKVHLAPRSHSLPLAPRNQRRAQMHRTAVYPNPTAAPVSNSVGRPPDPSGWSAGPNMHTSRVIDSPMGSVPLAIDYVRGGERCADGAHVVFIGQSMGSGTMRGRIPTLLLQQVRGRLHNASVSHLLYRPDRRRRGGGAAHNATASSVGGLISHVARFGAPSVCIMVKYLVDEARVACQAMGAIALLDCIDNHRCFGRGDFAPMRRYDAVLVQTTEHARLLRGHNISAEVVPPPTPRRPRRALCAHATRSPTRPVRRSTRTRTGTTAQSSPRSAGGVCARSASFSATA